MQHTLQQIERRLIDRFGRATTDGWSVTRGLPVLLLVSVALWIFAPVATIRVLTPWVGASALVVAGLYLGRVVLRIGHFYYFHLDRVGDPGTPRFRRLHRAFRQMVSVLFGFAAVAGLFYWMSVAILTRSRMPEEPRLLWALPVGGLVLSLVFGELVTRLLEAVDHLLLSFNPSGDDGAREAPAAQGKMPHAHRFPPH